MANIKPLLVLTLLYTTIWCAVLIDTAAVRPEELSEQLQRIGFDEYSSKSLRTQRATESADVVTSRHTAICHASMPCGWAGYIPFTRRVNFFMKNTCTCPDPTYKCVRVDDDLSVSAYVYHCRQNTTAEDIEPEDVN